MKTYNITLARAETRIITMQIKAADHETANDIAHDMLDDIDFDAGRPVHAEDWVQDVELLERVSG